MTALTIEVIAHIGAGTAITVAHDGDVVEFQFGADGSALHLSVARAAMPAFVATITAAHEELQEDSS